MSADDCTKPRDVRFRPAGVGLHCGRLCNGCGQKRSALGSKGSGLRWRCAQCVARRVVT